MKIASHSSIRELLSKQADTFKDKIFLECGEDSISFGAFDERTTSLANFLQSKGIHKGSRVATTLENCTEFILLWFSLAKIGAVFVPLNPSLTQAEITSSIEHSECSLFVVGDTCKTFELNSVAIISKKDIKEASVAKLKSFKLDTISKDDWMSILYTSGTTGVPKGVILPHRSYLIGGESFCFRANLSINDRMLLLLPLFHVNAQVYSTMGALLSGATLVVIEKFQAGSFIETLRSRKITQFNFLGVIANILLRTEAKEDDSKHTVRIACGAGLSKETIEAFEARFKMFILETYGLTECPMGTSNMIHERRLGSIGKPSIHPLSALSTNAKIVDDSGNEVKQGLPGEIILNSPAMALGYLKNQPATDEVFKGDWFHTGDSAYADSDGFFFFVDRLKDIIRRRGENLSSKQIEQCIEKLRSVNQVAVVPTKGILGDDEVACFIVLQEGRNLLATEVHNHVKNELGSFKSPAFVFFVDELPKTPTSKVSKLDLKKRIEIEKREISEQKLKSSGVLATEQFRKGASEGDIYLLCWKMLNELIITFDHIHFFVIDETYWNKETLAKAFGINAKRFISNKKPELLKGELYLNIGETFTQLCR